MRLFVKGNKSRNPNIEFLRIIGMFFIISAHMIGYTDVWKAEISFNKIVGIAFASWSILAVDIFVVIFSYFMSLSKDSLWLKWKKRIKKAINVIFETFVASLIARCIFMKSISLDSVILAAKTPFSGEYWYITAYLSLVVLSPLLDEILKKRMLRIIILSILIGLDFIPAHCNAGCYHNDVLQFCMIYLLVGTVKCNSTLWTKFNKITLLIGAGIAQSFYWVMFWTDGIGGFIHLPYHELMRRYSIVMVICAISVFAYTIRKPIRSYAVVNMFADATLAVYIWHAGPAWEGYIAEKLHIVQLYETPFWSIFIIPILLLCYLILSFMWVIFISIFEEQLRFLCKLKCAKVETLLDHYGEEKKMNRNYEGWYMYVEIVAFLANIFCVLSSFDRILFGEGKKTLFEGVSGMPLNVLMCCVCFSIAISIVIGIIIRVYMSKTKACPCDMCGGGYSTV